MPTPDRYTAFCAQLLAPLGPIATRYMFGCWCLYCDGLAFALVADGTLFLKVDDHSQAAFAARGMKVFQPFPDKTITLRYFQAPPELFEDETALRHWGGLALAAAARKEGKGLKKRPPKR